MFPTTLIMRLLVSLRIFIRPLVPFGPFFVTPRSLSIGKSLLSNPILFLAVFIIVALGLLCLLLVIVSCSMLSFPYIVPPPLRSSPPIIYPLSSPMETSFIIILLLPPSISFVCPVSACSLASRSNPLRFYQPFWILCLILTAVGSLLFEKISRG